MAMMALLPMLQSLEFTLPDVGVLLPWSPLPPFAHAVTVVGACISDILSFKWRARL